MDAHRLLIVDDEDAIIFAMRRYFRAHGFDVDTARELDEARGLLARAQYAAAIVDLRLTGVHGSEGLEILAFARERCPQTRTVLLTAYGSPEIAAEARALGADAVLSKPYPLPELAQVVLALIERSA